MAFSFSLKTTQPGPYSMVTQEGGILNSNLAGPNVASVQAAGDYVFKTLTGSLLHCSTFAGPNTIPLPAGIPNAMLVLEDGQVLEVASANGT